jgi:hypothetical protein
MRCLYCSREIGPFKLLRDSEFCSSSHRKSHGERLNSALRKILAHEPAPAGMAGYMAQWPAQKSVGSVTLDRWQFGSDYPTLLPGFAMDAALEPDDSAKQDRVPPLCGRWMPSLGAEPVARFVQASMQPPARLSNAVRVPSFHVAAHLTTTLPPCGQWMAEPAAEPAARMVAPQAEAHFAYRVAALHVPDLELAAELETAAEAFVEPPLSTTWMRASEPEPVFRFVRSTVAGETAFGLAPAILGLHIAGAPHVPAIAGWMTAPAADPVMAGVWPRAADTPIEFLTANTQCLVTDVGALAVLGQTLAKTHGPALAASAPSSQPSPVESWLLVAADTVRAIEAQPASGFPDLKMPELASGRLAACIPAPELAGPAIGAPPMAVESPLTPSAAVALIASRRAARMQAFVLAAATESIVPGFEKPFLSPAPSAPKLPGSVVVPQPISTISVTPPHPESHSPATAMPQPGIIPVEYLAQRMHGTPVCDVQWQTPGIAPAPPRFVVLPVFDRIDESLTRRKPTRKQPAFADVFTMPEARKRANPARGYRFMAIAASLLMGAMWFGTSMARLSRQSTIARRDVFGSSSETTGAGTSLSAASRSAGEAAGQTQAKGPVAWVRRTIASRAAYQAGENFHNGMQAWGSAPKSYAAGWVRNREGYVHPGALAIFNPSRNFKDYRFEFFGQVDQKSMGWVVRAKDTNNYYAMKFKVLEAGLRPVMAVVHYSVLEGKAGHQVETPLSLMVHNNRPFQVAVDVKGNHFSASIDGEEVDSWSDNALPAGGVGFFAEAGERSRLYWMKITKNDDWLGRVCSMLEGSDAGPQVTSELWGAGSGSMPRPGIPPSGPANSGGMTLTAAAFGLPFFPAQRTRKSKNGRYQPWSS